MGLVRNVGHAARSSPDGSGFAERSLAAGLSVAAASAGAALAAATLAVRLRGALTGEDAPFAACKRSDCRAVSGAASDLAPDFAWSDFAWALTLGAWALGLVTRVLRTGFAAGASAAWPFAVTAVSVTVTAPGRASTLSVVSGFAVSLASAEGAPASASGACATSLMPGGLPAGVSPEGACDFGGSIPAVS